MDDKRTQSKPTAKSGIADFFSSVKQEFMKISWTEKEELKIYTKIVVVSTFVFGMGMLLVDVGIQQVLDGLNGFIRLITG